MIDWCGSSLYMCEHRIRHMTKSTHTTTSMDEEQKNAFRAGYTGNVALLSTLTDKMLIDTYYSGAVFAEQSDEARQCFATGASADKESLLAFEHRHKDIIQLTLKHGAEPNMVLHYAAKAGYMDIVQQVLDMGAAAICGINAAAEHNHMEIFRLLVENVVDPKDPYNMKNAALYGRMGMVLLLLAEGADPNAGLEGAADGGYMDIVKLMLEHGADPNRGIESAAVNRYANIVRLLISEGATKLGTGLHMAAFEGYADIVELLLSHGATPYEGLHVAAWRGHAEVVKLLLAQPGIDVNKKDDEGRTPLDCALEFDEAACAELIRAAGGKESSEL